MSTIEKELEAVIESVVRRVVREELAAARAAPADEMVTIATFAREPSLNPATVRQMAKEGRIDAVRIGKRQWRVRRDSPIGSPAKRTGGGDTPQERARQLVEKLGLARRTR